MCVDVELSRLHQYVAALTVSIAVLSVGTVVGWTGNIIDVLLAGQYNNIPISPKFLSWLISLSTLASMIFSIPSGIMCDTFGRKTTLLFLTIPVIVGWLLILFANSIDIILIGRFITGIGTGSLYVLVPLYASEIAETEIRGKLASFFQLFLTFGTCLSYILGYVVHIKVFIIICATMPIIFFIAFIFQVESPIYKVKQKEYDEAKAILRHLRGKSYDVDAAISEIINSLQAKKHNTSIKELLHKRSTRIAVIVSLSLTFFQQASGSIVVIFYTIEIFASSGSTLNPKEATIVIGVLRVLASFTSSIVMDLFPRKKLLVTSSFFSAVGLMILGIYYSLKDRNLASEETLSTFGFMPVLGLSIYTVMISFGISSMPLIIASELFPPEIKGVGVSLMGSFSWFLLFLITRFYIDLKSAVGGDVTFYTFSGVCIMSMLFAIFVVPETKNKSLEQIQCELNKQSKTIE
ncbi:hypothetical protein RN001_009572 [Aquatica leii]|uniref:Major facilitator superfamily (MFS) profile domain-containing protein n=1 Tax=Aquatica leii TaxID=1421715 RepID=A0AAN7S877_9COLE|nr:hypothetical protein RN001_009572 [Aquatica leii]